MSACFEFVSSDNDRVTWYCGEIDLEKRGSFIQRRGGGCSVWASIKAVHNKCCSFLVLVCKTETALKKKKKGFGHGIQGVWIIAIVYTVQAVFVAIVFDDTSLTSLQLVEIQTNKYHSFLRVEAEGGVEVEVGWLMEVIHYFTSVTNKKRCPH